MNKIRWVLSYLVAPLIALMVLIPLHPSEVYAAPGELDPTFGDGGKVITDLSTRAGSESYALAVQSDGKLVLAGYADDTYEDLSFGLIRLNADGSPDVTFGNDGRVATSFGPGEDRAEAVAIQSDGKIVAAGYTFADAGSGSQNFALARYNADGALDPTFGTGGKVTTDFGTSRDKGYAIAIGSDGKIVVAGLTTVDNDDFALARYNADGSLDGSFGTGGKVRTAFSFGSMDEAYGVAVQSNGKIVAAGRTGFFFGLARYNLDGSLDGNFGTGGMVTTTFAEGDAEATALAIQADGKIVASGHTRSNSDYSIVLARYIMNGDLDTSFDGDGRVVTNFSTSTEFSYALAIQTSGELVVAGRTGSDGSDFALARYNPDGSPDGTFGGGGQVTTNLGEGIDAVHGLVAQGDGKIVAAGATGSYTDLRSGAARYNSNGSLDGTFGTEGKVVISALRSGANEAFAVAVQSDGKIVAGGTNGYSYNDSFALARYNPDGSLDQSFGEGGKTSTFFEFGAVLYALIIQPDGKIVAAGYDYTAVDSYNFALVRYNTDGSLDTTFGDGGRVSTDLGALDKAYAIAIYSDGKLVVAGSARGRFALARYDSSGTLDPTFDTDGILTTDFANDDDRATSIVIQPDDKVVAAGYATTRTCAVDCTLYSDFALARYNFDGSLDATFDTDGKVTTDFGIEDRVNGLARQADGKLVAGGQSRHHIGGTGHDFGLARYNPDGSLDSTFGAGGKVTTDFAGSHDGAYGLTLAAKGKIVAVGYMTTGPGLYSTNFALAGYNNDGMLDSSFGSGGKAVTDFGSDTDNANATAIQSNGKIIAAGYTLASGDSDFALARYRVTDEIEPTNTPVPPTATTTPTPPCNPPGSIVGSPNVGTSHNWLEAIDAAGPSDIWAVGSYRDGASHDRTLTMHWDGGQWSVIPSPTGGLSDSLSDVAVVSPTDVWAVGTYFSSAAPPHSFTMHWNGSQWSVIPSPTQGFNGTQLLGVTAVSATDVWAVGTYTEEFGQTFTLHWDGSQWNVVPSPNANGRFHSLQEVVALSADDVWAVGYHDVITGPTMLQTLVEHWDGTLWSIVPSPNVPSSDNQLFGVDAVSPNDVWAVGASGGMVGGNPKPLAQHWDGTQWTISPISSSSTNISWLRSVSAAASNDVWAVGEKNGSTLVEHWNGLQWSQVNSPNSGSGANRLRSVVTLSQGELWAVGDYNGTSNLSQTLIVRYTCGNPQGTTTPSPTLTRTTITPSITPPTFAPTSTTASPTRTPGTVITSTPTHTPVGGLATSTSVPTDVATSSPTLQPTGTSIITPSVTLTPGVTSTHTAVPTGTSIACVITFSDVPPTNTFYPFVRCLACRNILGGYSDNTFRPNNEVTRGQLSKIVANSANFKEPASGQTFEDVSTTSAFYEFVERMAARGIIGGYNCGGPGEPCGTGNKPYFRPNANATRGQISKIVSNAASFTDPPGGQKFADVAPGSTFYDWVNRLANKGIMGGYNCGGTGEPCGPGNLPYFRPGNNATRGQTSKIVSGAFFPTCGAESKP
ncbi:MAG TPA: S-layer homology domain-containing protein [Chloroflexia bacterium]